MNSDTGSGMPMRELSAFWWAFALRGGVAVVFSGVLFYVSSFFGAIFLDPITVVVLGAMLGFYILGNGVLLGVAAGFAAQHRVGIWQLLLAECVFALGLGAYIGFTLLLSSESLAWLAGLHAIGTGSFVGALAVRVRAHRSFAALLGMAAVVSMGVGVAFLFHRDAALKSVTQWLGCFELFYGIAIFIFTRGLHRNHVPVHMGIAS